MRTLIIGLDAFDPGIFERLADQGKLPNLAKFMQAGGYKRFKVANPPQSEVSWTSIATGLNPGGHGIFDFVHRDPTSYTPVVSLLPTKQGIGGTQFVPPTTARTIFEHTVRQGFSATSLWWPATFPARPELPVSSIPGLGTPDILGKLGVGTQYTREGVKSGDHIKTRLEKLSQVSRSHYRGELHGVIKKTRDGAQETKLDFSLDIKDDKTAQLVLGKQAIILKEGVWSPIIELTFNVGFMIKVRAITRVILTHSQPEPRLYFLPLQIHPLHSHWNYAAPKSFVIKTWKSCGPFLSIGWPQDTTGLEDGCITDEQFLDLCEDIVSTREKILRFHLQNFQEGLLAAVFDTLDRLQHMFWRDRPDIVEQWYVKLDGLVGRVVEMLSSPGLKGTNLVIVSDHGFTNFDYKVHLNRWLIENGYLTALENQVRGGLTQVDWSKTKAYALGLNSVYLNLQGREGQGIVKVSEVEELVNKLGQDLTSWMGPENKAVVSQAYSRAESLQGPLTSYGPDILVGYAPGYRASQQTGLGAWEENPLQPNTDHWGADHCIDPTFVPGVLFSSKGLGDIGEPSYLDFPKLAVGEDIDSRGATPPPTTGGEDREVLEERLKSLGYL